jgi:hypothetical protein
MAMVDVFDKQSGVLASQIIRLSGTVPAVQRLSGSFRVIDMK